MGKMLKFGARARKAFRSMVQSIHSRASSDCGSKRIEDCSIRSMEGDA